MAYVEPMDVDNIGNDFDDKENSLQHNNVLPRTPCTEKGYEELDVSELNMKLRYSITPASSPMSRSYTANCKDNKIVNQDDNLNKTIINENCNLTHSLNSTLTKYENVIKSGKLPLQALSSDQYDCDSTITPSIRRSLDVDINNCTITVSGPDNFDDNLSLPSTSSSCVHTPEATTPTKDMPKDDGGSPIMRGLKSVLNMFRSSQSPIPPEEMNSKDLSSVEPIGKEAPLPPTTLSSTPINTNKNKENNTLKRNSPLKDSVTFNEDLERELQWKDETTIIFKQEKIPIHKLFFQQSNSVYEQKAASKISENLNTSVEHMDISYNDPFVADKTMADIESKPTSNIGETISCVESDGEFVDCETTYTNNEEQSTSGLSVSIPPNTENKGQQDLKVLVNVGKENEALSHDLKICSNITLDKSDIEIKMKDETILKETITSNVISENNVPSIDKSNINTCGNDGKHLTSVAPVLDELELNMTENYSTQSNKEDIHSLDSKNDSNVESNRNENDLKYPEENMPNPHVEIIKSESEEYMNNLTTPLNIITDYQDNVMENSNSVVDNDSPINNDFSTDRNSTKHLGLLKECGIEVIVNKTKTQHGPDSVKHENKTENLINGLNVSCNISNVYNENNSLDTTDHTNRPGLTYFDGNNLIDTINLKIEEVNNTIVQIHQPINEQSNLTSHCPQNVDNNNHNDTDLQNLECLDIKHKTSDNSSINTDIYNLDQIKSSNNTLETKTENVVNITESKEILLDEICNVPSDIPLPLEDDIENDIKDPLGLQEENIILVSDGDVVSDILTENLNVNSEVIQSNDNILSALPITLTHLEEDTVPKQILIPHNEIIDEIRMQQDCISSANIAKDNINLVDFENSKMNSESFDSIPNTDTCAIDIQMNIDACTKNRQSAFDDKLEKSSDIQDGKLICSPMDITIKTRAADDENIISSNDDLHVSVQNLNNQQDDLELENIDNPFETKTKLGDSPPISPKLSRKGYNINFDDIEDPFATKTNIRTTTPTSHSSFTSPSSGSPSTITSNETQKKIEKKRVPLQNRRKSQPERKNQTAVKKPFNKSFDFSGLKQHRDEPVINIDKPSVFENEIEIKNQNVSSNKSITDVIAEPSVSNNLTMEISAAVENESPSELDVESNNKDNLNNITIVTSEKIDVELEKELHEFTKNSTCDASRNVFNLPEIDDVYFNPFATKSRVRQSPPPTVCSPKVINDKIESKVQSVNDITINIENTTKEHEHLSLNVSNTSSPLESTNVKENTIREVQTEDEDTIEGPFFEADELNDIDKMSDFESNKDMMPCEDFPAESENDKKDEELFIDAEAFEFLLNQNKSNVVADSGKESLFLKFDPLFAKRVSSDGVLSALNKIKKRQSTPRKLAVADTINETIETTTASTSKNPIEESVEETSFLASKPMMVVNPAVNSLVSPRKSTTPPRINRRSLTFTSPAIAVIDRLLSLSGNTSLLDHDASTLHVTKEYNDTDIALTQLRELLAEKEIHVHNLRSESKELKERLASMESQVRSLEKESEHRLNKVTELNKRLAEKTKMNKSMSIVVEEYERTIASLIAEMDEEKRRNAEERARLISERDEQTAHLSSMEVSFSDLHSKYEKSKQIILSMKANEDTYKKSIKEFEDNLIKMQKNYELLKQHATSKLNHANQELEKFNRSHEAEVLKLNAMIKRKELHITSLEESLTQKTKANEELTAICDELINKVG